MKKHLTIPILLYIAITTGLLWLNSCKKNTENQQIETTINYEESEAMLEHIMDFKGRMEYHEANPGLKNGMLYTAPDAVYELEALLNFNFCYTDIECNKKKFVKTEVIMPLDALHKIGESKLSQLYYEEIIDSIQAQMLCINYANMKLLLVDLEQTGTDSNGDAIVSIGVLVGNEGVMSVTGDTDGWWYGYQGGTCETDDPYQGIWDAAMELQFTIYAAFIPAPPPGYVIRTSLLHTEEIINPNAPEYRTENDVLDNFMDYKIYYASSSVPNYPITDSVRCVSYDFEIPSYLDSYTSVMSDVIIEQSNIQQTIMSFINCIVDGYKHPGESFIQHNFYFQIGKKWLVRVDEIEIDDILTY